MNRKKNYRGGMLSPLFELAGSLCRRAGDYVIKWLRRQPRGEEFWKIRYGVTLLLMLAMNLGIWATRHSKGNTLYIERIRSPSPGLRFKQAAGITGPGLDTSSFHRLADSIKRDTALLHSILRQRPGIWDSIQRLNNLP